VLYAGDIAFWLSMWVALLALFTWAGSIWPPRSPFGDAAALIPWALSVWLTYRLYSAYRVYLRFDHPLATVIASQVIVVLVYWKATYVVQGM
jgi:hypothetical protein